MIVATIAGRVGKDAAVDGDRDRIRWSVAVDERGKDGRTVVWVECTLWGKRGPALMQYITRGSSVAVSGRLRTWPRKDGTVGVGIDASEVTLLGGGGGERREAAAAADPSESW